jgi:hypothetical protein
MTGAMRRPVLRILLNAATVLSLLLCVATVAAWVRSYQACEEVWWSLSNPRMAMGIRTYRGGSFATVSTPVGDRDSLPRPGTGWRQFGSESYDDVGGSQGTFFNRFGFALDYFESSTYANRQLACPYWFILLLTAILPAARLAGWRRRARRLRMALGLCQHCGYDCRATPDRCPECGMALVTTAAPAREGKGETEGV